MREQRALYSAELGKVTGTGANGWAPAGALWANKGPRSSKPNGHMTAGAEFAPPAVSLLISKMPLPRQTNTGLVMVLQGFESRSYGDARRFQLEWAPPAPQPFV